MEGYLIFRKFTDVVNIHKEIVEILNVCRVAVDILYKIGPKSEELSWRRHHALLSKFEVILDRKFDNLYDFSVGTPFESNCFLSRNATYMSLLRLNDVLLVAYSYLDKNGISDKNCMDREFLIKYAYLYLHPKYLDLTTTESFNKLHATALQEAELAFSSAVEQLSYQISQLTNKVISLCCEICTDQDQLNKKDIRNAFHTSKGNNYFNQDVVKDQNSYEYYKTEEDIEKGQKNIYKAKTKKDKGKHTNGESIINNDTPIPKVVIREQNEHDIMIGQSCVAASVANLDVDYLNKRRVGSTQLGNFINQNKNCYVNQHRTVGQKSTDEYYTNQDFAISNEYACEVDYVPSKENIRVNIDKTDISDLDAICQKLTDGDEMIQHVVNQDENNRRTSIIIDRKRRNDIRGEITKFQESGDKSYEVDDNFGVPLRKKVKTSIVESDTDEERIQHGRRNQF